MEKKKKSQIIINLLATVATVSALLGTFATLASASDVSISTTQYDKLVPYVGLDSIEFRNVQLGNIPDQNTNFIVNDPFVFYDYGFDTGRGGKFGMSLNYPIQNNSFTNSGRTLFFDFFAGIDNGKKYVECRSPIYFANQSGVSNNFANCEEVVLFFDEVIFLGRSNTDYFDFHFDRVASGEYDSKMRVEFETLTLDPSSEGYVSTPYSFEWRNIDSFNISVDSMDGIFPEGVGYIRNLKVIYNPFVNSEGDPVDPSLPFTTTDYIQSFECDFTCVSEDYQNTLRRYWFQSNPIIEKEFVGIGDVSLMDWVSVAVGGFFDFEVMPNVTIGGIGLVFVGVALFMLFIRIYKG